MTDRFQKLYDETRSDQSQLSHSTPWMDDMGPCIGRIVDKGLGAGEVRDWLPDPVRYLCQLVKLLLRGLDRASSEVSIRSRCELGSYGVGLGVGGYIRKRVLLDRIETFGRIDRVRKQANPPFIGTIRLKVVVFF